MKITLEQIDVVRSRTNVSYKQAKEALERFDGDVVEALSYLDEGDKVPKSQMKSSKPWMDRIKALIEKGNVTKFIVSKDGKIILNIPVNIVIIVAMIGNYVFAAAVLLALVLGYKFNISSPTQAGNMPVAINKTMEANPANNLDDENK